MGYVVIPIGVEGRVHRAAGRVFELIAWGTARPLAGTGRHMVELQGELAESARKAVELQFRPRPAMPTAEIQGTLSAHVGSAARDVELAGGLSAFVGDAPTQAIELQGALSADILRPAEFIRSIRTIRDGVRRRTELVWARASDAESARYTVLRTDRSLAYSSTYPLTDNDFTVSSWAVRSWAFDGSNDLIVSIAPVFPRRPRQGTIEGWILYRRNADVDRWFGIDEIAFTETAAGGLVANVYGVTMAVPALEIDALVHLALAWDLDIRQEAVLYVDGVEVDDVSLAGLDIATGAAACNGYLGASMNSPLGEIVINRTWARFRSADEITALMGVAYLANDPMYIEAGIVYEIAASPQYVNQYAENTAGTGFEFQRGLQSYQDASDPSQGGWYVLGDGVITPVAESPLATNGRTQAVGTILMHGVPNPFTRGGDGVIVALDATDGEDPWCDVSIPDVAIGTSVDVSLAIAPLDGSPITVAVDFGRTVEEITFAPRESTRSLALDVAEVSGVIAHDGGTVRLVFQTSNARTIAICQPIVHARDIPAIVATNIPALSWVDVAAPERAAYDVTANGEPVEVLTFAAGDPTFAYARHPEDLPATDIAIGFYLHPTVDGTILSFGEPAHSASAPREQLTVAVSNGTLVVTGDQALATEAIVVDGAWTHVHINTAGGTGEIYLNGELFATGPLTYTINPAGGFAVAADAFACGPVRSAAVFSITQIRVYDGNLTVEQIDTELAAIRSENDPVVEWLGRRADSGIVADLSGAGNPLILTDDAVWDEEIYALPELAEFYDLETSIAAGSGAISLVPGGGRYPEDMDVAATAVPDPAWKFTEWSGDLTGSDNPDTITVDADKSIDATFVPSFYGQSFAGNQWDTRDSEAALNFGTGPFTVEAWFYAGTTSIRQTIAAKIDQQADTNYTGWALVWQGNKISYGVGGGAGSADLGNSAIGATRTLTTGTWYHIAVVRAANGAVTGYLNGVVDKTYTEVDSVDNGAPLRIGCVTYWNGSVWAANWKMNGRIAQLRFWNIARSQVEIQNTRFTHVLGPTAGLVAEYPMIPGAGQTVTDTSGNDRHLRVGSDTGTDTNDPTWLSEWSDLEDETTFRFQALQFGVAKYAQVAAAANIPTAGEPRTVLFWYKRGSAYHQRPIGMGTGSTEGFTFDMHTSATMYLVMNGGSNYLRWDTYSQGLPDLGTAWNCFIISYDGASNPKLSINGSTLRTGGVFGTIPNPLTVTIDKVRLGNGLQYAENTDGIGAQWAIYSGAWTQADVNAYWAAKPADLGLFVPPSGAALKSYWTGTPGSSQTVTDRFGTNHATFGSTAGVDTNDPTWAPDVYTSIGAGGPQA